MNKLPTEAQGFLIGLIATVVVVIVAVIIGFLLFGG